MGFPPGSNQPGHQLGAVQTARAEGTALQALERQRRWPQARATGAALQTLGRQRRWLDHVVVTAADLASRVGTQAMRAKCKRGDAVGNDNVVPTQTHGPLPTVAGSLDAAGLPQCATLQATTAYW
jgi:hypothetical protein